MASGARTQTSDQRNLHLSDEFNKLMDEALDRVINSILYENSNKLHAPHPKYGWHGQSLEDSGCKFPVGTRVRLIGSSNWVGTVLPVTPPENMVGETVCAMVRFDGAQDANLYGVYRLEIVPDGT